MSFNLVLEISIFKRFQNGWLNVLVVTSDFAATLADFSGFFGDCIYVTLDFSFLSLDFPNRPRVSLSGIIENVCHFLIGAAVSALSLTISFGSRTSMDSFSFFFVFGFVFLFFVLAELLVGSTFPATVPLSLTFILLFFPFALLTLCN